MDKPICWRCRATKESLRDETASATSFLDPDSRLTHMQALERIVESGGTLSPVWGIPWLSMQARRLDWLHVADQGSLVGSSTCFSMTRTLGRILSSAAPGSGGRLMSTTRKRMCLTASTHSQSPWCSQRKAPSSSQASGAEIRHLVPFALKMVNQWPPEVIDHERLGARTCIGTSDSQSEVGEVFGEIGGELPAKFGRRFSSVFCWENRQKHFPPKLHRKFHHQTSLRGSGLWRALHACAIWRHAMTS